MRRPLIAGNWKMHKTPEETEAFLADFLARAQPEGEAGMLLIPPFTSLDRAGRLLEGSGVDLGAQDLHPEPKGAFTGAISGAMLAATGCRYVLVGHSERRHVFGDDDATVGRKLRAALTVGLSPILCVGETLNDRRSELTNAVVASQLAGALDGVEPSEMASVTVAYEPVWAIGTGETAMPEQAQEANASIRLWLCDRYDVEVAEATRILYGGSVKPDNAAELLGQPDVDGALVGGASLDPEAFASIVAAAPGAA